MKSLIMKDILILKRQALSIGIALVVMLIASLAMADFSFMGSVIVILGATLPLTLFSYDQLAHWESYCLTLPITRRQMVTARYLSGLLFSAVGCVISALLNLISSDGTEPLLWLGLPLGFMAGSLLYMSILLPLVFRFGPEKSRILMIPICALPFILIMILTHVEGPELNLAPPVWIAVAVVVTLLLLLLSWRISCAIYERKEF